MPRAAVRFRQADLARAIKAVAAAGLTIGRIEIDPATGKINIETRDPAPAQPAGVSSLAEWRRPRGAN